MTLPVYVLRPEPGADTTRARCVAAGLTVVVHPLFTVEAVAWALPDVDAIDALLLTSANAVRHGGAALSALDHLPAWCVGAATADAARAAGFTIAHVGTGDAAALLASAPHPAHLLWLAGATHKVPHWPDAVTVTTRIVYRTIPITTPFVPPDRDHVLLLHSAAAAAHVAQQRVDRSRAHIVAISAATAAAAGTGWRSVTIADEPRDAAMVACTVQLCQSANTAGG